MNVLVELVTDEYAEIRQQACEIIRFDRNVTYNDNFTLEKLFEYIFKSFKRNQKSMENDPELLHFVFTHLTHPLYEKYKFFNAYESRIFNYDKPNKYREDTKVLRALLLAAKVNDFEIKFTQE